MCISVEFIKKETFVQVQKELYKCVSLSNSSRKIYFYRCRKSCTNVYVSRIHQERHICTGRERAVEIYVRNHQERNICTDAEKAVQICISVEFIKKDTFVQVQKELYKCISLSNSSRKIHLYRRRKGCTNVYLCPNSSRKTHLHRRRESCTNVYLCRIPQERHICTGGKKTVQIYVRIHQERHICTGEERAVQMCISLEFVKKDTFVQVEKEHYKCVSLSNSSTKIHFSRRRKSCTNVYLCRIHQERHICTDAETTVQMCISVEFIKKDTFVQAQKELYKCVSLSNSSRKIHLYRSRKGCTNVYLCPNSSRKTHLYRRRKSCTNVYLCRIHQERHISTGGKKSVQIYVRIHQERHICTGEERAVQMCIFVEFVKKDTFVQLEKEHYKCVSLSNSSRKTQLHRRRKTSTNVYLCRIHHERHICTCAERAVQMCISVRIHQERHSGADAERAVQMCISVEFIEKDTFVQAQKELYKCVSLSEFIKKDTFVQTQKELYKCVSLSNSSGKTHLYRGKKNSTNLCPNSSRKTHLYRRRKSCTNVYLS